MKNTWVSESCMSRRGDQFLIHSTQGTRRIDPFILNNDLATVIVNPNFWNWPIALEERKWIYILPSSFDNDDSNNTGRGKKYGGSDTGYYDVWSILFHHGFLKGKIHHGGDGISDLKQYMIRAVNEVPFFIHVHYNKKRYYVIYINSWWKVTFFLTLFVYLYNFLVLNYNIIKRARCSAGLIVTQRRLLFVW